jgi:hypothetical protein
MRVPWIHFERESSDQRRTKQLKSCKSICLVSPPQSFQAYLPVMQCSVTFAFCLALAWSSYVKN